MNAAKPVPSASSQGTRNAILDATEEILRSEGYAAVSSRRITQHTGMRSRVVHYHFGSMDDLFLALIARIEERYFGNYERLLASDSPVKVLWPHIVTMIDSVLLSELSALALHRAPVREATLRSLERARLLDARLMERLIAEAGIKQPKLTPMLLAVLMAGVIRVLSAERAIGMTTGHEEVLEYIRTLLGGAPEGEGSGDGPAQRL